jgi:hypothetical protein
MNETPAEQRLLAHLETLREHPPESDERLVAAVIATARWQAAARPYLSAAGVLATAFATGATVLLGARGGR